MSVVLRLFLPLLALLMLTSAASAQPVKRLAHRDRLYDAVAHGSELFVVGHPGLLLHSTDQGKTFRRVPLPTKDALFAVAFNAAGVGAIVGRSGLVLVSRDKGRSWTKVTAKAEGEEEAAHLFAVEVLPDGVIVAVGEFGAIMRSEDGGKSWTRQPYSAARPKSAEELAQSEQRARISIEEENEGAIDEARLTGVRFADQRGFIVGEFGLVLVSEDGGKSWNRQNSQAELLLFDLSLVSRDHVVAVGSEGTVIETKDGGTTWSAIDAGTHEHLYGIAAQGDRFVVSGAGGIVLRRAPGKEALDVIHTDVHTWLTSVAFSDANTGIIVGGRGYVLRTTDGGAHYSKLFGE